MQANFRKQFRQVQKGFDREYSIPLVFIIVLITVVTSFQEFFFFMKGERTALRFFSVVLYQTVYFSFFLVLGSALQLLSRKRFFQFDTAFQWIALHLVGLGTTLIVHQFLALETGRMLGLIKKQIVLEDLLLHTPGAWLDVVIYILLLSSSSLSESRRRFRENEVLRSRIETDIVMAHWTELRSKIHPQLLFTMLETMSGLLKEGKNTQANHVLSLFSDFLRTTVYDNDREFISLEEELLAMDQYINLEQIRWKQALHVQKEIAPETLVCIVPNFFLQPLIEELLLECYESNCSRCTLHLRSSIHQHDLMIHLSLSTSPVIPLKELQSIRMTHERLSQLYSSEQGTVQSHINHGTFSLSITIPHHTVLNFSTSNFEE
jgi:sensor histidine kinase YesM